MSLHEYDREHRAEIAQWRRRALFAEEAIKRVMRLYDEAVNAGLTMQPTAVRDALQPQQFTTSEPRTRDGGDQ